jgi:diguanylate cyclase (GGDEF)-like protein/PAS domain S-box-containing protein
MMPDIKTLMLLYVIINAISAGAVAVIWSQNRGRLAGISFWLVDMILQAIGAVLIVLRGLVPDLISMVLANTMIQAGALIIFIGLERFTGKKGWQVQNYVMLAVFIVVFTYYSSVQPDLGTREIALSAMSMIFTFQCCWLLLRRVDPGIRQVTRLTGIIFAVYAAFSLARVILHIIFPSQTGDFFKSGAVDALAITVYIVLSVCLTISLVLMVNRRLLADVKAQEEKFTTAFHSSPYAVTLTRPSDGKIFEVNDGFVDISGYQYAEIIGKTTVDLHLWVREGDRLAVIKELAQGREVHGTEYEFRSKTGKVLTGLFSASLITVNNEKCILSSIADITERKQAEEALRSKDDKYRSLVENINDVFYTLDTQGNITYISPVVERFTRYKVSDLIGKPFIPLIYPDDLPALLDSFNRLVSGQLEPWEFRIVDKDGRIIFVRTSSRPLYKDGEIVGITALMMDITERKQMQLQLEKMATHDYLTGLPNRVLLTDRFTIAAALARRNKARLAVMSLDLDKFKTINDTLGHEAGDHVLKTVSARLIGIIRASDTLARIGGDEFILVMQETRRMEDADAIAQKIVDSFTEPLLIDGHQLYLSTSIGIAIYPEEAEDLETLINKSDAAMYYSKGHGRNQFKFFGDGDVSMGGDHKSSPPDSGLSSTYPPDQITRPEHCNEGIDTRN